MKTGIKFYLLVFLAIFCITETQAQWEWLAPFPSRIPQTSFSTVIGTKAYFVCEGNKVYSTSDTGRTFTSYPPYAPMENTASQGTIAFADSLIGYVADIGHGEFRTTDGGWTWAKTGDRSYGIFLVAFSSSKIGWKLGYGGFYKTTDAGVTWSQLGNDLFDYKYVSGNFVKLYPVDNLNLWVLKSNQLKESEPGPLWHSTNGGVSWTNLHVGINSDSMNQVTYTDIVMNASGHGCITGSIYTPSINFDSIRAVILTTSNFGVTWKRQEFLREGYNNIISLSNNIWVLLGYSREHSYDTWGPGIERRSTDAGDTWEYSDTYGTATYPNPILSNAVYIPYQNSIISPTSLGTFKSIDQGKTFGKLVSERDMYISFIAIDKTNHSNKDQLIVCPAYWQDYILSKDGGATWENKKFPESIMMEMRDLRVVDNEILMLTIDNYTGSKLKISTDFGENWGTKVVSHYSALRGLSVYGKDTLVMQTFPYIMMSTDGGNNWNEGPLEQSCWINATQILKGGKIIAVGSIVKNNSKEKGIIYVSPDGGLNWRIQVYCTPK